MAQNDGVAEIAGALTREEMGIRDDEREATRLTPMSSLQDSDFERSTGLEWLSGRHAEKKPLEPAIVERAKLAVEAYKRGLEEMKQYHDDDPEYGEHVQIVGNVRVSNAGPEGRYMVNFTTTNVRGEDDWRAAANTMMFDERANDLDHTYGAREWSGNWVYGERDGKLSLIGQYKDQYDKSGGKLTEALTNAGWTNLGEVRASDTDRHAGFITPPKK